MKQPKGWAKLLLGLILTVVVVFSQAIFLVGWTSFSGFEEESLETLAFIELAGGILAILFVIALGGKPYLRSSQGAYGFAWQAARVFLIADAALTVLSVVGQVYIGEGKPLADTWLYNVILLCLLCLGIGMFEEGVCRGLLLQGLLARMGSSKTGMVAALVISSLLFGAAHVIGTEIADHDLSYWMQMVLKTLQTGIIGFILGVVVIKTRSLWPAILIHGANDFILMVVNTALWGDSMSFEYVATGEESAQLIGIYLFMCAIYLPSLLFCIREIKKMPGGDRGAFYRTKQVVVEAELPVDEQPVVVNVTEPQTNGMPIPPSRL